MKDILEFNQQKIQDQMINKLSEIILKFVFNLVLLAALSWITCQIVVDLWPYLPGGFVFYLKTLYIYKIFNCRLPIPITVPRFILFLMRHIISNYIETVIEPVCRLQIPRDWNAFERAAEQGWEENPELGDDAPQPPVRLSDAPQPPVRLSNAPQPPVRLSDAPQPPVRLSNAPQPPVRLSDAPQPPVRLSDAPQPPADVPQPPVRLSDAPQPPADVPQPSVRLSDAP